MPGTPTPNYGLVVPTVNGDADTWGGELNNDLLAIDSIMAGIATTANDAIPTLNGSASGLTISPSTMPAANDAGYMGSPINSQGNDYTFALSDIGKTVLQASGATHTYTIPLNATVAFPVGTIINVVTYGGATTLSPASGVTLANPTLGSGARTMGNVSIASLQKISTDVWLNTGSNIS